MVRGLETAGLSKELGLETEIPFEAFANLLRKVFDL
jgi:hypothetical protein